MSLNHEELTIYNQIQLAFTDVTFSVELKNSLESMMEHESRYRGSENKSFDDILNSYKPRTYEDDKDAKEHIRTVMLSCYILLVSEYNESIKTTFWRSYDELLQHYGDETLITTEVATDSAEKEKEKEYLLRFRNFMMTALTFMPGKRNKGLLINACRRLEGSGVLYTPGSGQTNSTKRRVAIFERESKQTPSKRNKKATKHNQEAQSIATDDSADSIHLLQDGVAVKAKKARNQMKRETKKSQETSAITITYYDYAALPGDQIVPSATIVEEEAVDTDALMQLNTVISVDGGCCDPKSI